MSCVKFVLLFTILTVGLSVAQLDKTGKLQKLDKILLKKLLNKDCVNSYSFTCFKLDIVSWVDKLDRTEDLKVLPGVSLVKEPASGSESQEQIVTELAREFPDDPDARLNAYLMRKVSGFFDNHSVKLNLLNAVEQVQGEARKKKGGEGGGLGYLLAAGAMMKGTIATIAMGAIAAIAGKALMTALISLVLSAVLGLKSLTHHGGHDSYQVVHAKPVYDSHGGGYDRISYSRSLDVQPLPIALQPGYKPTP